MNKSPLPLSERLKKGAGVLGQIWKDPTQRCVAGWSIDGCTCEFPNKFCKARIQWLTLAVEDGRELQEDPYGIALAMTASEWDSTLLSMKIEHPKVPPFFVGANQDSIMTMADMVKLMEEPDVLESMYYVLKAFPKAKVQGIEEAAVAPGAAVAIEPELEANPDEAFE